MALAQEDIKLLRQQVDWRERMGRFMRWSLTISLRTGGLIPSRARLFP
jgi:hypothetical protein